MVKLLKLLLKLNMKGNRICIQLSDNLRYLRNQLNLSQQGIADVLKITRSRYAKYEEVLSEPPIYLLVQMSVFFKVSIDDLCKKDLRKWK